MHSNMFAASLLATAAFMSTTMASPIFGGRSTAVKRAFSQPSLAVYWGQGPNQKRLADFCADTTMDIIPIGFVNVFPDQTGGPGTNYGNACGSVTWKAPDGTQTNVYTTCDQIAEDIAVCQAIGKKIFASIGGEASGNFIASSDSAKAFADFLWGSFGPLQDPTLVQYPRPFGLNTVVDGFDLDIESGGDFGYADLVNELRVKFATQSSKTFYISSAPQCVVPDAHLDDAIKNSVIDYVFVQYYNTDQCSAASLFSSGSLNTATDITFGWAQWLKDNSMNQNIKMFLGLPASKTAANPNHYLDLDQAQALIEEYACSSTYQSLFGGVMIWEATYSDNNQLNGHLWRALLRAADDDYHLIDNNHNNNHELDNYHNHYNYHHNDHNDDDNNHELANSYHNTYHNHYNHYNYNDHNNDSASTDYHTGCSYFELALDLVSDYVKHHFRSSSSNDKL
ncbi:uncharacterized protein PV07_05139 [Cladophialophora immunda]|uniref:chitinase n=1 Tax=Cladophialophora immunda TaxID=569365 RepID=A0A0D2CGH2_9EURO|nr:uncharacterized protein PV07_05139 [Cladophialophora immunda]KIW29315.1 hypothetical protein PV07_05139 [Cladophialophora immunda]